MSGEAERTMLLEAMASLGRSEGLTTFLMPRAAKRLLDPRTVVVIGARGTGKSAMARFLVEACAQRSEAAYGLLNLQGAPFCLWLDAFSGGDARHPDATVLDAFVRDADDDMLRGFWLMWLALSLGDQTVDYKKVRPDLAETMTMVRRDPALVRHLSAADRAATVALLDDADRVLKVPVVAVYDDLDLVGAFDPTVRTRFVGALLTLWSSFSRRYKNIRAKIFIPPDLLDLRRFDTGEVSKLLTYAERLEWDTPSLYRLVLRHLAQSGPEVRAWLMTFGVTFEDQGPDLGWMPAEPSTEIQHRWLTATLGSVVASRGTRNFVERWIPNRLRDGNDRVVPRSILGFFSEAARRAQERPPSANRNRLLSVTDAADAIGTVGTHRVAEIRAVYAWVDRLEALRGKVMPMPRSAIEALLDTDPRDIPKPTEARDGRTVTTELIRMGMLRELRLDDLLDLPDLFVEHFGVRRA